MNYDNDEEKINIVLSDLDQFLKCTICYNYFVEARTTIDCLHTCNNSQIQYLFK